jgi:hypothetical protein
VKSEYEVTEMVAELKLDEDEVKPVVLADSVNFGSVITNVVAEDTEVA